jgi:hypothetical protein
MAKLFNLAKMTTSTTGAGTISLGTAVSGFLSFSAAGAANADVLSYGISDGANSEVGFGTYGTAGTTLARTTIINSTNSGSAIDLSGTAVVFITPLRQDISSDGWLPILGTFTYASATTINVSSGAASIYSVGDKIRFQNNDSGTYLYGYIITVADTLLTIIGDAVPNATLTDAYYSKVATPLNFPQWFQLGTPTWTTNGTAFTNQPINNKTYLSIVGRVVTITGEAQCHATSGGTGAFKATFAAGTFPAVTDVLRGVGVSVNISTLGLSGFCELEGSTILWVATSAGARLATNSEYFSYAMSYKM